MPKIGQPLTADEALREIASMLDGCIASVRTTLGDPSGTVVIEVDYVPAKIVKEMGIAAAERISKRAAFDYSGVDIRMT